MVITCNFCSWQGNKENLLQNNHCPNCQSPSTKRFACNHIKKECVTGIGKNKSQKCKNCLIEIYL